MKRKIDLNIMSTEFFAFRKLIIVIRCCKFIVSNFYLYSYIIIILKQIQTVRLVGEVLC